MHLSYKQPNFASFIDFFLVFSLEVLIYSTSIQ